VQRRRIFRTITALVSADALLEDEHGLLGELSSQLPHAGHAEAGILQYLQFLPDAGQTRIWLRVSCGDSAAKTIW